MRVCKRDGALEDVAFDKVVARIAHFCSDLPGLDPHAVAQRICSRIYDGVDTAKLDELGAEICSSLMTEHPDFGALAARIIVSNHQKNTLASFVDTVALLHDNASPIVSDALHAVAGAFGARIEAHIDHSRDFLFDYFGYKTLERSYLLKLDGRIVERPQHMWMRVALGIYATAGAATSEADLQAAFDTYTMMSTRLYTHATPTLFNAGTPRPGLSSCFLMGVHDSIDGIYKNLGDGARISKYSGGIGLHVHNIRGQGALIRGTNGQGNGIVPMLRVYNTTFRYVNQCFAGDTPVYTSVGPKRMDAVAVGDLVLTGDASFKPVLEVCRRPCPTTMRRVAMADGREVWVTGEHIVFVLDSDDTTVKEVAVKDLRAGDRMGFPCRPELDYRSFVRGAEELEPAAEPWYQLPGHDAKVPGAWYRIAKVDDHTVGEGAYDVYDFNVKDNHSYVTSIGLVHNSGKRNGSAAIYLEPWHVDVFEFIALRRNTGSEEERCRDLFLALWVPDLFMERVKANGDWSLFCPDSAPGLSDVHGAEFVALYERYEAEGRARKVVKATELWQEIVRSQIETGTPYMLYKDRCQRVNQSNLGIIRSSNLCVSPETEVLTKDGNRPIRELADQAVDVWNGKEWARVTVKQTGADQPLLRVTFSDGTALCCTAYHKFYVTSREGGEEEVRAGELQAGMATTRVDAGKHPCKLPQHSRVTVAAVVDEGRRDDTYCFEEPAEHRGVFNGILTGQCSEILLYSDDKEYAVCNLASLVLPTYVKDGAFDYAHLHAVAKKVVRAMDRVIDANYYSCIETERSNMRHRPVGIGIQGLADVYMLLRLPFESAAAMEVNRAVAETIYHATLEASMEMARERKEALAECVRTDEEKTLPPQWAGAYATFAGCPASKGILQYHMWDVAPTDRYDWDDLKARIQAHGMRHSMLVALMPTASTSQIMGYTESFEAITSNFMVRRTLAGEFIIVNNYLVRDLIRLGLWDKAMKDRILAGNGSVQHMAEIPAELRELYKTVWEIKQRSLIDQSAARGPFVCHTQSLNLYMEEPDLAKVTNMAFYGWKQGLKTGMYYLRTRPKAKTTSFTLDPALLTTSAEAVAACRRDNPESCLMCSA